MFKLGSPTNQKLTHTHTQSQLKKLFKQMSYFSSNRAALQKSLAKKSK